MVVSFLHPADKLLIDALLLIYQTHKEWSSYQDIHVKKSVLDRAARYGFVHLSPRHDTDRKIDRQYAVQLTESGLSFAKFADNLASLALYGKEESKEINGSPETA